MRSRKRASLQPRSRLSEPRRVWVSGTFGPRDVPEESERPSDYPRYMHDTLLTHRLRSPSQVTERLDRLIGNIKKIQEPFMHGGPAPDVLIVAHGHILRAFTKRWLVSGSQSHFMKLNIELTLSSIGVGHGIPFHYDDGTWCHWGPQLCAPQHR